MFNPTPQRAPAQAWAPNPVIQPPHQGGVGFASTDWANVPRMDYQTEKFRQLAIPDPARVVEDASEFEPWQPKQLGRDPTSAAAKAEGQSRSSDLDKTLDQSSSTDTVGEGESTHEGADSTMQAQNAKASDAKEALADASDDAQAGAATEDQATLESSPDQPSTGASQAASDGSEAVADTEHEASDSAAPAADHQEDDTSRQASTQPETSEPGLDSAAVQEACDAARHEGQEQGREEGRIQGREETQAQAQQALQAALDQAEADKAQALQQLREELEGEIEPLKRQLSKTVEQVESLIGQPDKLYEHVKRLSLHLAEQLVLGELNMSPAAIERLIQRCLDELDLHGNHVVTVELNPQDKARLQERAGDLSHTLSLQAVQSLQPGSVRVIVNDTMVEDLVGNRLDALARGLLVQPEVWREQSPFFRQPLAQRDTEIQDAPTRSVAPRDATPGAPKAAEADAPIKFEASETAEASEVSKPAEDIDPFDAFDVPPSTDPSEPIERLGEQHD